MITYFENAQIQKGDFFVKCKCGATHIIRKFNKEGSFEAVAQRFCPSCGQPGGHELTQDEFHALIGEK